jgi:hypothetical protein
MAGELTTTAGGADLETTTLEVDLNRMSFEMEAG